MIFKAFAFIICVLLVLMVVKPFNANVSKAIIIIAGAMLTIVGINHLTPVFSFVSSLSQKIGFDNSYLEIIIKCTAICFLGSFASQLCKDSGEGTLAHSAEFICRCTVISLTLPIYIDVFNWIIKLWENI